MVVADDWGTHPGWAGYEMHEEWTNTYVMHGYPGCGDASSPPFCTNAALYGDVNYCNFNSFFSPDAANYVREGTMSCDGSPGMSGSGIFRMNWIFPYVSGQYNDAPYCIAAGCAGNSFPNVAGLITAEYGAAIDYFNADFP